MKTVRVDIWADFICPWSRIGYRELEAARKALSGDVEMVCWWMPLRQYPDAPPEGILPDLGDIEGASDLPPPHRLWNTLEAHKLARWALMRHDPDQQTRLVLALFAAHFQRRRNLADEDVLLEIAADCGFDRKEAAEALADRALAEVVEREEARAKANGIAETPTLVIGGKRKLAGAQASADYIAALREMAE